MATSPLPLFKGTLDLLVLKTLSWGPRHGFAIAQWLEARSEGEMSVDDSALYHSLHRLEERGLIEGAWAVTELGRRARFYRLTPTGAKRLKAEAATWQRYARVVGGILAHVPAGR
jgi:transcriptional regulator